MIDRQTSLSANVIAFCRYLRNQGFSVGMLEEQDALTALQLVDPFENSGSFRLCLQSALCKSKRQLDAFSQYFQTYWKELDKAIDSKIKKVEEESSEAQPSMDPGKHLHAIKSWLYGNKNDEIAEAAAYSSLEVSGSAGLPPWDEREMREVSRLVKQMVTRLANKRSRRYRTSHRKDKLDFQKTIRRNILQYDEIVRLIQKTKKKDQLKVVLICDVSRSMELYSRFLIQFMYVFQRLFSRIACFVFSTRMYYISDQLNQESIDKSLEKVLNKVKHWSGGTQIGGSLAQFSDEYAHRHIDKKTLVFILSDGWDSGDSDQISTHMKALQRRAMKVIWLNPLAGNPNWKPEVKGMKAATPYIDSLLPFHNMEDLRKLAMSI